MRPSFIHRSCSSPMLMAFALPLMVVAVGCGGTSPGGSNNTTNPPTLVSVSVSPQTAALQTGGTQQFTATIAGTSNTAVTWKTSSGAISTSGMYTAPSSAGSFTVTATSQADTTKSASATVTVTAPAPPAGVSIRISPTTVDVASDGTQQFTATVTGTLNAAVTWKAVSGTINSSGLYTAPATATTDTVTATSAADTTKSASATVLVGGAGSELAQVAAQVTPGQWFHFTAAENSSWNNGALLATPAGGTTDNATAWSTKGMWNPVTKEFYFVGGVHCGSGDCPQSTEVLKYNDSSNTWSVQYNMSVGHTYEGTTVNTTPSNNNIYLREFASTNIDQYSIASQSWGSTIVSVPSGNADCCLALEYFPDRNSLITIDNDYGVYEYTFSNNQWSNCLFGTSSNVGCPNGNQNLCGSSSTESPWARYDAANHRMLFGGCTNVYALSSTLTVTTLASSPFGISVGTSASPVTIDPDSGKLVSWDPSSGNTFTSDGTSWVDAGSSPFSNPVGGGLACAPVSTYSVIMCFYAGTNTAPVTGGTIWLYKTN